MSKVKISTEQIPSYLDDVSMTSDPSNAILVILEIEAKSMLQDPFVSQLVQVIITHCIYGNNI
jgi:hypothetical protein